VQDAGPREQAVISREDVDTDPVTDAQAGFAWDVGADLSDDATAFVARNIALRR
jgi:hypothetical protein